MFECRNHGLERRIYVGQPGKEEAPKGNEGELYHRQSDWLIESVEDRFRGGIGQGGAEVPNEAEGLED